MKTKLEDDLPPERRAGTFLVGLLRGLDTKLDAIVPRVVASSDAEAIHDLRVTIRKIRTILKIVRPVFGRRHTEHVRAAFTVLHRSTGALRDEEVFREAMALLHVDGPAFDAFVKRRAARERRLRRQTIVLVKGGAVDQARRLLGALLSFPPKASRDAEVGAFAREVVLRARRRVEKHRDADTTDAFSLHELRILYKELRYPCELLAPVLPRDLSVLGGPASSFQSRLGEIHDVDMAVFSIARSRSIEPALEGRLLRALAALRARRVARFVAERSPTEPPPPPESRAAPAAPPRAPTGRTRPPRAAPRRRGA